jgi:hypothetical protein
MTSWWKVYGLNAYVNPAQCRTIYVTNFGTNDYRIQVDTNAGSVNTSETLEGVFSTAAAAEAAVARLVQGIDPSTF